MIKTFRPSKLRGRSISRIEDDLARFFECDVVVQPDLSAIDIDVFAVYDDPEKVLAHAHNSLSKVGSFYFVSHAGSVVLRLELNERAKQVILNKDKLPKKVVKND